MKEEKACVAMLLLWYLLLMNMTMGTLPLCLQPRLYRHAYMSHHIFQPYNTILLFQNYLFKKVVAQQQQKVIPMEKVFQQQMEQIKVFQKVMVQIMEPLHLLQKVNHLAVQIQQTPLKVKV